MELLKMLSGSEIVAQIVSFLLVFFVLRVFVWKAFLKILDDRKEKIASEFKAIEDTKAEIHNLKSKYDVLIGAIEETAKIRIKEAISTGELNAQDIREKARKEADRIIQETKQEIQFEIARSREELKIKIIELTMKVTEDIIREKLTSQDDRKLIEQFLKDTEKLDKPR